MLLIQIIPVLGQGVLFYYTGGWIRRKLAY
jgi:hypothetical protein